MLSAAAAAAAVAAAAVAADAAVGAAACAGPPRQSAGLALDRGGADRTSNADQCDIANTWFVASEECILVYELAGVPRYAIFTPASSLNGSVTIQLYEAGGVGVDVVGL